MFQQGADGKQYVSVLFAGEEEPSYVELEEAKNLQGVQGLHVVFNGAKIPVADLKTFIEQRDPRSSDNQFGWNKESPQAQKNKIKRTKQLQETVEGIAQPRVEPGAAPGIRVIKDEEYFRLNQMYRDALAKGEEKQCEFQPLSTYQHKVVKARPILKGEVGVQGSTILRLETGYGEGLLIQVHPDTPFKTEHQQIPELSDPFPKEE